MSKRRMISLSVVDDDVFITMSLSAQALYFHLCMRADDDGFITPIKVMRAVNANDDDLRLLIAKRYVLAFPSGVVVIKAWPIMNTIKKDRLIPTTYQKEAAQLTLNEWGVYTERRNAQTQFLDVNSITTFNRGEEVGVIANVGQMAPQVKLSKVNISKSKDLLVNSDKPNSRPENGRLFLIEIVGLLGFSDQVKATEGRLRKLKVRLKTFSAEDLRTAAKNLGADQYMQGDNDGGKRYGNIDYFLRSDEIVDKWLLTGVTQNKSNKEVLNSYV